MTTWRSTTTPSCIATAARPARALAVRAVVRCGRDAQRPRNRGRDERARSNSIPRAGRRAISTWMENLKDWCISRQLWWGHRIPVFYCDECGWMDASMEDVHTCPKCGAATSARTKTCWILGSRASCGRSPRRAGRIRPSSWKAIIPPRRSSPRVTSSRLWVARMIMASLYFLDEIPFKDVVIYATILAKDGTPHVQEQGQRR